MKIWILRIIYMLVTFAGMMLAVKFAMKPSYPLWLSVLIGASVPAIMISIFMLILRAIGIRDKW